MSRISAGFGEAVRRRQPAELVDADITGSALRRRPAPHRQWLLWLFPLWVGCGHVRPGFRVDRAAQKTSVGASRTPWCSLGSFTFLPALRIAEASVLAAFSRGPSDVAPVVLSGLPGDAVAGRGYGLQSIAGLRRRRTCRHLAGAARRGLLTSGWDNSSAPAPRWGLSRRWTRRALGAGARRDGER